MTSNIVSFYETVKRDEVSRFRLRLTKRPVSHALMQSRDEKMGAILKALRVSQRLTGDQMGAIINRSKGQVSKFETGSNHAPEDVLAAYASHFKVPLWTLHFQVAEGDGDADLLEWLNKYFTLDKQTVRMVIRQVHARPDKEAG